MDRHVFITWFMIITLSLIGFVLALYYFLNDDEDNDYKDRQDTLEISGKDRDKDIQTRNEELRKAQIDSHEI